MKKQFLYALFLTISLLTISCSNDDSSIVSNDDNPTIANNKLRINALPTSEFALFRITYVKMKEVNGILTTFGSTIKSDNSTSTENINLDEFYEEDVPNYLVIKRMGVSLPANINVGIWLIEPDLKFYINADFTDNTEWFELKIEVKKINGVYSFTKA